MKTFFFLCLFILSGLMFASCSSTITPEEEQNAAESTVNWLDQKFGLIGNNDFVTFNARVMDRLSGSARLIKMSSSYKARAETFDWSAFLLNVPQVNAFSVGNGSIVVTRGLIVLLETEAQYASVLAHEMAHQILGHTQEAILESNENDVTPTFYFSVDKELEADRLALMILGQARYEPSQALIAFNLAYRNQSKGIADGPEEAKKLWLDSRALNLSYLISQIDSNGPGKTESREFNKVRSLIAQNY